MSGRKVELDEVTIPAPLLESSSSQKLVPVTPTPISEEANDVDHEASDQAHTKIRRSTRTRSAPEWYGNPVLEIMLLDNGEPSNYEEAMAGPDSNKVWTSTDLPDDRQAIENKWIVKRKTDADSSITIYKARIFAKGFR